MQNSELEIERTLERNRAAIAVARQKSEKYRRTLTSARAEIQSARTALRKLGYLK